MTRYPEVETGRNPLATGPKEPMNRPASLALPLVEVLGHTEIFFILASWFCHWRISLCFKPSLEAAGTQSTAGAQRALG